MKFDMQKKQAIILYLLEKIDGGDTSPVQSVLNTFDINKTTVYDYIKKLIADGVIEKLGRNKYQLVTKKAVYNFKRSKGELDTDTYIFHTCFEKYVKNLPDNVFQIWLYAFSEMTNNVMDHSAAEDVSVLVKQNYLNTEVYIADNGVGIFNKIKEHFNFGSLDDAICELFKGKLTTDTKHHSGEGIFFSSKMMDSFFIFSSGKVFNTNKYENTFLNDVECFDTGTCVVMELSNHTKKQAAEVFDMYADVDGGFSKTKITLKNIFETSPVSRSQAKRVCNRLESFEEVILDFEGIDWIGQGFAHQLFSVFAKEHPDIKFTITNANDSIIRMYNHVSE